MANTTITLALNGDVPLDLFVAGMRDLQSLIVALTEDVSPAATVDWYVDDLEADGAVATIRGESRELQAVEAVAGAFLQVGKALAAGRMVPYSRKVAKPALGLLGLIDGKVTSIRFETRDDDATIVASERIGQASPAATSGYGAVEGRVQTVSGRDTRRFTLHDAVHDRVVSCYLDEDWHELTDGVRDRRAVVEGWVSRDPVTGQPVAVRRVRGISLLDDVAPSLRLREARGVAPLAAEAATAVDAIRSLRDA